MKTRKNSVSRFAVVSGALALTASLFPLGGAQTAHAIDKSDAYKAGAAVLGAAGAYYAVKGGKTLPAVIAGAGAYYAYKKGRDIERNENNNRNRNRRDNRPNTRRPDRRSDRGNTYPDDYSRYPDNNRYPDNRNGDTNRYPDNRYPDNRGDVYAGDYDRYPDYGYNGLNKSKTQRGPIRVK